MTIIHVSSMLGLHIDFSGQKSPPDHITAFVFLSRQVVMKQVRHPYLDCSAFLVDIRAARFPGVSRVWKTEMNLLKRAKHPGNDLRRTYAWKAAWHSQHAVSATSGKQLII